jgi:uncharacterized protein YuzE
MGSIGGRGTSKLNARRLAVAGIQRLPVCRCLEEWLFDPRGCQPKLSVVAAPRRWPLHTRNRSPILELDRYGEVVAIDVERDGNILRVTIWTGRIMKAPDFATRQDQATNGVWIVRSPSSRFRTWMAHSLARGRARAICRVPFGGWVCHGAIPLRIMPAHFAIRVVT